MTQTFEIKVGDFAVIERPYSYAVVRVTKATPARFEGTGEWRSGGTQRYDRRAAVFVGDEAKARRLFDQLTSSMAQFSEDTRNAGIRRDKRNAEFIASANGA